MPNDLVPASSATDTALHAARGGADRGTLRATTVGQYDLSHHQSLTLTFAAEHSALRETETASPDVTSGGNSVPGDRIGTDVISWRRNSGVIAQGNLGIDDALYLTGGLRLERNDGFTAAGQTALLPMFGVATVGDIGATTVKLRGAYGRSIRPVQTPSRSTAIHDIRWKSGTMSLEPEEQSGTELGADLLFGRDGGVHITRFDQRAFGLIQPVSVRDSQPSGRGTSGSGKPAIGYLLQNVGEIANRGWEMESAVRLGALGLSGALSLVDSRVRRIARGYTGDLQEGSRMLAVPARTASLSVSWTQPRWLMTIAASRASDWINYDRLKIAQVFADTAAAPQELIGANLRKYWMPYRGITRLRATLSRDLTSNVSLKITGDNLTNAQRGEPDNITVLPGRTLILGLNAKMR